MGLEVGELNFVIERRLREDRDVPVIQDDPRGVRAAVLAGDR